MEIIEHLWRIQAQHYENGETTVTAYCYPVTKRTRCGVWIRLYGAYHKFVNLNARKKWACPTMEEARASFIARKRRQIALLEWQLECARRERVAIETTPAPAEVHCR